MQQFTPTQHVLIEDENLALWLGWLLLGIPAYARSWVIWRGDATEFRSRWNTLLRDVHCGDALWTPAGLRGGGATDHFLTHRDLAALRRRGRWQQQLTLDRYVQEGVLLLSQHALPKQLRLLAELGAAFLRPSAAPPPPSTTPLTGKGSLRLAPCSREAFLQSLRLAPCSREAFLQGGSSGATRPPAGLRRLLAANALHESAEERKP